MKRELTVIIVKPEGLYLGMDRMVRELCQKHSFDILVQKEIMLSPRVVARIYADKIGEEEFDSGRLLRQMTSGKVVIFVVAGDSAVAKTRSASFVGQTHLNTGLRGWIKVNYYKDPDFWDYVARTTGNDPDGFEYVYNGVHAASNELEVLSELQALLPLLDVRKHILPAT